MFTESEFTTTVLIAGAGPTGLTLARDLQRRGVPYRIVEPGDPFDGSRGKGIQPRTLEVLDDLGLIDEFRAYGADYPAMTVHRPDDELVAWRMDELHEPTAEVPYPNMLMIPQWRTAQLLAAGIGIERDCGVAAFTQQDGGVRVTLTTGEVVTARYLVGADGGRSTVRKLLAVPFEGQTYESEQLLIADVRLTGLDRDSWHIWPGETPSSFRLGLCPLPGTDNFQLTAPPDGRPIEDLVRAVDPGITITHVGWTSTYRANMRMVSRYRVGNVFLAGDAAHVHSPAGGQGLNTGIQDAYNLGWKLATGDDARLDTYEAERLPVAAGVLGISTRLHRNVTERTRRDDPVLRQLSLSYRDGPLAAEHRAEQGPVRAGDRMPDGIVGGVRLFDLFRGPHWTLLVSGGAVAPAPHEGVRVEQVPGRPGLLLIRPDGYLGCAADGPEPIEAYLRKVRPGL